jgi:hypothetical protein
MYYNKMSGGDVRLVEIDFTQLTRHKRKQLYYHKDQMGRGFEWLTITFGSQILFIVKNTTYFPCC